MRIDEVFEKENYYKLKILYQFLKKFEKYSLDDLMAMTNMQNELIDLGNGFYICLDKYLRKGFITGSDISAFIYCPRFCWIKWQIVHEHGYNGIIVIKRWLKSMALGRVMHVIYRDYFAEGMTEVLLYDTYRGLAGHIDEVRLFHGNLLVIEFKSGYSVFTGHDFAKAQVCFYIYLLRKWLEEKRKEEYENIYGILLTRHTKEQRFKAWYVTPATDLEVEALIDGIRRSIILSEVPPKTEKTRRCKSCPYKHLCEKF